MTKLAFYSNPMSRGQIAHWMLEEVRQPYDITWLKWGPEGNKAPAYLAINPMGKIPTLVHGAQVITEAAAICLYLADAFPKAELGPRNEERGAYYRWVLFAAGPVEQAVTCRALDWQVPPGKSAMVGYGSYEATVAALEQHFEHNLYVCGTRFTAADVYVGSTVLWGLLFKTIPERPSLTAYAQRLQERAAYQKTLRMIEEQAAKEKRT